MSSWMINSYSDKLSSDGLIKETYWLIMPHKENIMSITKAKAVGTAILALVIILAGCSPDVSNPDLRRGSQAKKGSPSVTNQSLSAPTGVTTAVLSSGSIRVSWNAVPGATDYRVFYGEPNDNKMLYYATVPAPIISWDDKDALSTGQTYYYQVQAVNADGSGPVSDMVSLKYTSTPSVSNPFLGTWHNVDNPDETWVFTADLSVFHYYSGTPSWSGTYTYSGNNAALTLFYAGGEEYATVVTAAITGSNSLKLHWDDSGYTYDEYFVRN